MQKEEEGLDGAVPGAARLRRVSRGGSVLRRSLGRRFAPAAAASAGMREDGREEEEDLPSALPYL